MKTLLLGASGLVGQATLETLESMGHNVTCAARSRKPTFTDRPFLDIDANADIHKDIWLPRLEGFDCVVNAVGILVESKGQSFAALHEHMPKALFAACADKKIKVIQISSLGADESASTAYHLTKKAADDTLFWLGLPSAIIYPSLIWAKGAEASEGLLRAASAPLTPLPAGGHQKMQPVHIEDLKALIRKILLDFPQKPMQYPAVGPSVLTLKEILMALRKAKGLSPAPTLPIPYGALWVGAQISGLLGLSKFTPDTLKMLMEGNHFVPHRYKSLAPHWEPGATPVSAFLTKGA